MFNRTIEFKDANKNYVKVKIEIKEGRFSMCGEMGCSSGQCNEHIKPKNEAQKSLLSLWDKWHLNDMKAGTEKQEEALIEAHSKGKLKDYDYDKAVKYLKSIRLYTDKGYKYGSAWLKRALPSNIIEEVDRLCNVIEAIEEEEKEGILLSEYTEADLNKLLEEHDERIIALALHLGLTDKEMEEITPSAYNSANNDFSYAGIDYFVGTDGEAEQQAREYLQDGEDWKMAVEAGQTTLGEDDWIDQVINIDGVGHILNHWDGSEDSQEINGTNYFICRR